MKTFPRDRLPMTSVQPRIAAMTRIALPLAAALILGSCAGNHILALKLTYWLGR